MHDLMVKQQIKTGIDCYEKQAFDHDRHLIAIYVCVSWSWLAGILQGKAFKGL
jgi:hypothetical protein